MRKWLIGSAVTILILLFSLVIQAKPGQWKGGPEKFDDGPGAGPGRYHAPVGNRERNDAQYIIHRTAGVIFSAQKAAQRGRRYFGLGQAVAHQQAAWDLYGKGAYRDAIYHSLRARNLAFQIIAANRSSIGHEYYRDEMEDRYAQSAPRDNQLDIGIESTKVGKDSEAVHFSFHLDIAQ